MRRAIVVCVLFLLLGLGIAKEESRSSQSEMNAGPAVVADARGVTPFEKAAGLALAAKAEACFLRSELNRGKVYLAAAHAVDPTSNLLSLKAMDMMHKAFPFTETGMPGYQGGPVAVSAGQHHVAYRSCAGLVRYNLETGDVKIAQQPGSEFLWTGDLELSPTGRFLATCDNRGHLVLCDMDQEQIVWQYTFSSRPEGQSYLTTIVMAFTFDETQLLTHYKHSDRNEVCFMSTSDLAVTDRMPTSGPVLAMQCVDDDLLMMSVGTFERGEGYGCQLVDMSTMKPVTKLARMASPAMDYLPKKNLLAVGVRGHIQVFNTTTQARIAEYRAASHNIVLVRFLAEGRYLVYASPKGESGIIDCASGKPIQVFDIGRHAAVSVDRYMLFADGKTVDLSACRPYEGTADPTAFLGFRLPDSSVPPAVREMLARSSDMARSPSGRQIQVARESPSGDLVAYGTFDGRTVLYKRKSNEAHVFVTDHYKVPLGFAFSEDSHHLLRLCTYGNGMGGALEAYSLVDECRHTVCLDDPPVEMILVPGGRHVVILDEKNRAFLSTLPKLDVKIELLPAVQADRDICVDESTNTLVVSTGRESTAYDLGKIADSRELPTYEEACQCYGITLREPAPLMNLLYSRANHGEILPDWRSLAERINTLIKDKAWSTIQNEIMIWMTEHPEERRRLLHFVAARLGRISAPPAREVAEQIFRRAVAQDPNSVEPLMYFSSFVLNEGRHAEVSELSRRILDIDPNSVSALSNLALALSESTDNHAEALELVTRAMALNPNGFKTLDVYGVVCFHLGRFEEAEKNLRQARAQLPWPSSHSTVVHYHLAQVCEATARSREAVDHFVKSLSFHNQFGGLTANQVAHARNIVDDYDLPTYEQACDDTDAVLREPKPLRSLSDRRAHASKETRASSSSDTAEGEAGGWVREQIDPSVQRWEVRLETGERGTIALSPRFSPRATRLELTPVTMPDLEGVSHLEGYLKLGDDLTGGCGQRFVIARGREGGFYNRLHIDLDRDGSLTDERPIACRPRQSRNKWWSTFSAIVRVKQTVDGTTTRQDYPLDFWIVVDRQQDVPGEIRFTRKGFLTGIVRISGKDYNVILSDGNNDGLYGKGDYWDIRPVVSANREGVHRRVGDFNWAGGEAYMLELADSTGRKGWVVHHNPGVTQAEDEVTRDKYYTDRTAKRALKPIVFRHDIEEVIAQAKVEKKRYFLNFGTRWCGNCRLMHQLVYTAQSVSNAAEGTICIDVDGDKHHDLVDRFQIRSYPAGILFGPDGGELERFSGYQCVENMTAFFSHDGKRSSDPRSFRVRISSLIANKAWDTIEEEMAARMAECPEDRSALVNFAATQLDGLSDPPAHEVAEHILREAVVQDPNCAPAISHLVFAAMREGRHTEAVALSRRILDIEPNNVAFLNNLAWILSEFYQEYDEALDLANRAIALRPDFANALDTRGVICSHLGRFEEAEESLREVVRLRSSPSSEAAMAKYHLACVYESTGRNDQAANLFQESVNLHDRFGGLAADQVAHARENAPSKGQRNSPSRADASTPADLGPTVAEDTVIGIPREHVEIPEDMIQCAANLRKIYGAIRAYEQANGNLPAWLSDLVPHYLNEVSLLCPAHPERTRAPYYPDPKLPCSYSYEFSPTLTNGLLTCREWKEQQLRQFGDVIPIIRCIDPDSDRVLNVSRAGEVYWSPMLWESMFTPQLLSLPQPARQWSSLIGQAAPTFALNDLNGRKVNLADFKGSIVLLDFWATWCGPCRDAIPHLERLYRRYQDQGVVVMGLNRETDHAEVRQYAQGRISYPVLLDAAASFQEYGIRGVPTVFYVDRDGTVRHRVVGFRPGNEGVMEQALQRLLGDVEGPSLESSLPQQDALIVVSTRPETPTVLSLGEKLIVSVKYDLASVGHARIWVHPYAKGTRVRARRSHGSPLYPAGTGELEGWISFDRPMDVDEVRVQMVPPGSTEPIATAAMKINAKWR